MTGFRLLEPAWLLLLPLVIGVAVRSARKSSRLAVVYSSVELLRGLPVTTAQRLRRCLPWIRMIGLLLVVIALTRPQMGREEFRIRAEGIAIEMCIDRSGSMKALDFELDGQRVNRLEVVRRVFRDFVAGGDDLDGRTDDLIGLVSFGGFADARCPLTLDHGALLEVLDSVEIAEPIRDPQGRIINDGLWQQEQATAIGDALALATERLKDNPSKSRVIILLSDGENTAGVIDPKEAAEAAKTFGLKVYSIGVGSTGTAPFPATDVFGRSVLQPQPVRLDETTLRMLADTTGGRYYNARDTEALRNVYAEIDQLEKTQTEGRIYTQYTEWFRLPLGLGLCLVGLQLVLSETRFRTLP